MNYKGIVPLSDMPRSCEEYVKLYRATEHAKELNRKQTREWREKNAEYNKERKREWYQQLSQKQKVCEHEYVESTRMYLDTEYPCWVCPKCKKWLSAIQYQLPTG